MQGDHNDEHANRDRAREWLSQGFELLAARIDVGGEAHTDRFHFDTVVVGSGYGGGVAAARFAGAKARRAAPTAASDRPDEGRVCVLERGREYLPGAFPEREADLAGHVRFSGSESGQARGRREALFDLRLGEDINVVVANGLGGGSLINAGVMEEPHESVLRAAPWPSAIREDDLSSYYDEARVLLGLSDGPHTCGDAVEPLRKQTMLRRLAAGSRASDPAGSTSSAPRSADFRAVNATVARHAHRNAQGIDLNACVNCGDCFTGCNFGAKESLDVNLLAQARQRGAEIYSGATVLRIEPLSSRAQDGWTVYLTHTNLKLRARQGEPLKLRTRRLVLAAGTLGSTEILLRSRGKLNVSDRLGHGFSGNGDMLASAVDLDGSCGCVGNETEAPAQRAIGPTITAMIDRRSGRASDYVIQELAVPGALRRLWEQSFALAHTIDALKKADRSTHTALDEDPCAIDSRWTGHSLVLAVIGHDDGGGRIELNGEDHTMHGDGAVRVRWSGVNRDRALEARHADVQALHAAANLGGRLLANPLWRPLPPLLEKLFGAARGPLLTVHPLGGCVMADNVERGVVNHLGQVFCPPERDSDGRDCAPDGLQSDGFQAPCENVYPNLVVLDGSIVPGSLGINPALTITALAQRAVDGLMGVWDLEAHTKANPLTARPVFRRCDPDAVPPKKSSTTVRVIERLQGSLRLPDEPQELLHAELTLESEPVAVTQLTAIRPHERVIRFDPERSTLRLFAHARHGNIQHALALAEREPHVIEPRPFEDARDADAIDARLSGTLHLFARAPSRPGERLLRGVLAWVSNRGLRETTQLIVSKLRSFLCCLVAQPLPWLWQRVQRLFAADNAPARRGRAAQAQAGTPTKSWSSALSSWIGAQFDWLRGLFKLASTAGEVRTMDYALQLGEIRKGDNFPLGDDEFAALRERLGGARIVGTKRITYASKSNPLRQLMRVRAQLVNADAMTGEPRDFDLDVNYLAERRVPLMRIEHQPDHATALIDLACLLLYTARIALRLHTWSFKLPDDQPRTIPQRLPGKLCGLPDPEISEINVAQTRSGAPVSIRLTRYRSNGRPLLMIHGYSASGTTFTHPLVNPNLAQYMHAQGADVWVLDLRSSMGLPSAREPWTFEQIGYGDIPAAVEHIVKTVSAERRERDAADPGDVQLDVVAHCMGSAMLLMALLGDSTVTDDPLAAARRILPSRIRRLLISQVPLRMQFSAANTFRAYVLNYAFNFLDLDDYEFNPTGAATLGDELLDRLLSVLPYPEAEFRAENPLFSFRGTPWTRTRHRMDALYGRAFSVNNLSRAVRHRIDDHFGPLNIETVSQVIDFAAHNHITDKRGHVAQFRQVSRYASRLPFPIRSIHGEENGLIDAWSAERMAREMFGFGKVDYDAVVIPGYGHQDCLIGKHAYRDVFPHIKAFFDQAGLP